MVKFSFQILDLINLIISASLVNVRPMPHRCPSCGEYLALRRLECPACALSIESSFELPAILKLSQAQLDFVEVFIKNRGVIRDVERELGVSYPTVRAKLDEVVVALGFKSREMADEKQQEQTDPRRAVLDDLREGRISPEDALRALRGKHAGSRRETGGQQR